MSVECPACEWPLFLEEQGPREDPTILLTGTARIGKAAIKIIAVRINRNLRAAPDYRSDVQRHCYHVGGYDSILSTILEEFEDAAAQVGDLLGEEHFNIVQLPTGPYQIWVIPATFNQRT